MVSCYLYDVALKQQLTKAAWTFHGGRLAPGGAQMRRRDLFAPLGREPLLRQPHRLYRRDGPKEHRMKRLAIMDSDGANHRFITTGQAMALTPRYSPDYRHIVYLSYLNGRRASMSMTLRAAPASGGGNEEPHLRARWSPDGKSILYSMAVAGNTNIYRVSAMGGTACS
jgi:TolB protein